MDADRFQDLLEFVAARHEVWELRQLTGQCHSSHPIVRERKFTNVFRILDPGSQFILTDLNDSSLSERELLARLFLYRHTGRVPVWRHLREELGRYPLLGDLEAVEEVLIAYSRTAPVFTTAYLVYPQSSTPGTNKVSSIVDLTRRLFVDSDQILRRWVGPLRSKYAALVENKGVGPFMSMQIATDWGYTSREDVDRENEFVVAGPGSVKGCKVLAPGEKPGDVIEWVRRALELELPHVVIGEDRHPSSMDAQNVMCEFSKLVRFMGKPLTGQPYQPEHPGTQPEPEFPSHWSVF